MTGVMGKTTGRDYIPPGLRLGQGFGSGGSHPRASSSSNRFLNVSQSRAASSPSRSRSSTSRSGEVQTRPAASAENPGGNLELHGRRSTLQLGVTELGEHEARSVEVRVPQHRAPEVHGIEIALPQIEVTQVR